MSLSSCFEPSLSAAWLSLISLDAEALLMGSIHCRYAHSSCRDMGIVRRPFSSFGRVETHRRRLQPYLARSSLVDLGSHPATHPSRVFLVRPTFCPGIPIRVPVSFYGRCVSELFSVFLRRVFSCGDAKASNHAMQRTASGLDS